MAIKEKINGKEPINVGGDKFNYAGNQFFSFDREPSSEENRQEIEDHLEKGQCPRDGGVFKKHSDGRIICENCGLVLSEELKGKYGLKI